MKARVLIVAAMLTVALTTSIGGAAATTATARWLPWSSNKEPPSLQGATEWVNSPALKLADLRGKVVLVDFWTYTCINWLRTAPYIRAWAEKYEDQGLVVIGVHSPEFEFEKDIDNVRREIRDMDLRYPIAVDSNHAIWREFDNAYWPALYFIDAQGRIRAHHFGEGRYEESEELLQKLLAEAGDTTAQKGFVTASGQGPEAAADWQNLRSPENYLGYQRTQKFASPGGAVPNKARTYTVPKKLKVNSWALAGQWMVNNEATLLHRANGRIVYRFHARDLHLVMGPAQRGTPVRFRVRIDGQPPGAAHGTDTDAQGNGVVTEQRLYQLIRQPQVQGDRLFEIEFLDPGVAAYAFTFG